MRGEFIWRKKKSALKEFIENHPNENSAGICEFCVSKNTEYSSVVVSKNKKHVFKTCNDCEKGYYIFEVQIK